MCLAIPALIVSVEGNSRANVDFGQGVLRAVNVSLVNVKVGDYVIVHAGYAIQVIKEEEAKETLRIWREVLENDKQ
jgi:hydrogenase expression/formation protein HypC